MGTTILFVLFVLFNPSAVPTTQLFFLSFALLVLLVDLLFFSHVVFVLKGERKKEEEKAEKMATSRV